MESNLPALKSPQATFSESGTADFPCWVQSYYGRRRMVIDGFTVTIKGTVTVAGAAWDGRDVVRLVKSVQVTERDSFVRWSLSGFKSRLASIMLNGIEWHHEHASVPIGAAQAVEMRLYIPMTKRRVRRPKDFAIPADALQSVTVNFASLAEAQTGATVLSVPSFICTVMAHFHTEGSTEAKSRDQVKHVDANSATQASVTSLAGIIHDLFICKEDTTAGGALLTLITDAKVDALQLPTLTASDYRYLYRVRHGYGASGPGVVATERFLDPVIQGAVLPIMSTTAATRVVDGKKVDQFALDVTSTLTGWAAVYRMVLKQSDTLVEAAAKTGGVAKSAALAKTAKGSRASRQDGWSARDWALLPKKFPLGKADDLS